MKRVFVILSVAIFSITFSGCIKEEKGTDKIRMNDKCPIFTVLNLSGQPVHSDTLLKEKVSLIVFFNTTCGDCQRELPKIEELWGELKNQEDFRLMVISRGEPLTAVSDYVNRQQITMPVYLDPEKKAFQLFADKTVPRIYLSDRNGIVRFISIEKLQITVDQLKQKIETLF